MTAQHGGDGLALFQDDEGRYYGVPRTVIERNAVPVERRSQLESLIAQDRSADRAAPEHVSDTPLIFEIRREELEEYRLSEEQVEAFVVQANSDDVRGYDFF